MNENFTEVRIKDIAQLLTGFAFKSKEYSMLEGIPVLRGENITLGKLRWDKRKFWNKDIEPYKKYLLKKNDIVLGMDGYVGKNRAIINKKDLPLVLAQRVCVIRSNELVSQHFIKHVIFGNHFFGYLNAVKTGSTVPHISLDQISDYKFLIPKKFNNQKKIASVLTAYDKLIENNTRRIEILEEMAQRIYKEWFVDFKYPGHENDELVDSELGMIPEDWELNNLDKYVSFDRGTEPGSKNYQDNNSENTIPFIRVGDLGSRNKKVYIPKELAKEKVLDKKDIVITLDGTVGIVKTGLEGCFSTGLRKCRIINDFINREFLFHTLKSRNIQSTIRAHATGSTILHASSSIKYMKFALPTKKIMNNFFEMINPIISEEQLLTDKNYNLSKTRDYILPKLISGKVDVFNLNIDTSILDD